MKIIIANKSHASYAEEICKNIEESAKVRGTGIARRTPEYIISKMEKGNAVIALDGEKFAGFCYIETWSHEKYVANSGLIVHPDYRKHGLAKDIKKVIFKHSREKYPHAKIFGITTGLAVMKINYELGYQPVTFSELTDDEAFWKGCQTCKNYDVLTRTEHKMCLCTGMLYDPAKKEPEKKKKESKFNDKAFQRLKHIKQTLFYKKEKVENE
ncbi:GNAT family N-acetyltransferase [Christiangramia fulva]|uniref:GNAT family N-acetyltransferase n=1 Tax=Christiangramia fulva TaxID=2126553 RepID=A0A2R3Z9M7_9FLAO|nr:GNAT family N-acetyltransferase [Christiangramia fulva]AVR46966.1 GNAT family N-acetyltransferase [Christiangramia fulva]